MRSSNVPTRVEYISFEGGTDTQTSTFRLKSGMVLESQNYEPNTMGGYSRMRGYERLDGRTSPSSAVYLPLACTLTTTPAAGTELTIGAATVKFVSLTDGGAIVTTINGTIPASTNIEVTGPTVIGVTAADTIIEVDFTSEQDAQALVDSADVYRALIVTPTGAGAIRGVVIYDGDVYCFRDDVGETYGQMYKASLTGWTLVDLGEEIEFTNANVDVTDGDTLTQGGVTATVDRVVVETGTLLSGTNTGRLILSGRGGGNFATGAATSTGSGALTLSAAESAIALPPGGRYEFDIYNFFGQADSIRLYGCNGVGRAFEYDGTAFVPINTGAAVDKPKFIKANRNYLYLAQGSSLVGSSVGEPTRYVALEGAAEFPVGDTITGIGSLTGQSVGVMARNSSFVLNGSSIDDWVLQTIRGDVGAVPYSMVTMSDTYMLDDRGITSVRAVQEFGNFADATLTRRIQPTIDSIRSHVVGAYASRQKGHYVLVMDDTTTLTMAINYGKVTGLMSGVLGFIPSCVFSGEDSGGIERVLIGGTDGQVYEFEKGSTFDGDAIQSYVKIHFNDAKTPRLRKRYRKLVMEMNILLFSTITFSAEFSFGESDIHVTAPETYSAGGTNAVWDVGIWDVAFWDSQSTVHPPFSIDGSGLNVSLLFGSETKLDFGHSLRSALIHYTPRRQER